MLLYRIVYKKYSHSLESSGMKGRWNSEGNNILYCAESIALAFLENVVRRQGVGFNDDFKIMFIQIPDKTKITSVKFEDLDADWRTDNNYSSCRKIGDQWYQKGKTLLLKVPSAVLPQAFNYLINLNLEEAKKIKLVDVTNLVPDERIEAILKKYSPK